jgi:hypothetical protein
LSLRAVQASRLMDVIERFDVSKRRAQRMSRALEAQFPDTHVSCIDADGR